MDRIFKTSAQVVLIVVAWMWSAAAGADLQKYDAPNFTLHTDLSPSEAREARLRISRMAEEYARRTAGFAGRVEVKLPFYLFSKDADYYAAGGARGSGGVFDGEKLMVQVIRYRDGRIDDATWHIIQHEGFHQFARAAIGQVIPLWAGEGLAEYFGEGLFTGDEMITGVVPQVRLERVQLMIRRNLTLPLNELMTMPRDKWDAKILMAHYDQSWSVVHFLAHGENGALQKPFSAFMSALDRDDNAFVAYEKHIASIPNLEKRWKQWWLALAPNPSRELYARATLATLTSTAARAAAAGRPISRPQELWLGVDLTSMPVHPEDQMPQSLVQTAAADIRAMVAKGDMLTIGRGSDRGIILTLNLREGTRMVGRYIVEQGRVKSVTVETVSKAPAARQGAER